MSYKAPPPPPNALDGRRIVCPVARPTFPYVTPFAVFLRRHLIFEGPAGGQFSLAMTFRVSGSAEKAHGKYLAVVLGNPDHIRRTGASRRLLLLLLLLVVLSCAKFASQKHALLCRMTTPSCCARADHTPSSLTA